MEGIPTSRQELSGAIGRLTRATRLPLGMPSDLCLPAYPGGFSRLLGQSLTRDDPFFAPLVKLITQLRALRTNRGDVEEVVSGFNDYIQAVCQSSGPDRLQVINKSLTSIGVRSMLKSRHGRPKRAPVQQDIEADLDRQLNSAHQKKQHAQEVDCLIKLAKLKAEKKDFLLAAKLYNAALYLEGKHQTAPQTRVTLMVALEELEGAYVESLEGKAAVSSIFTYRERLEKIRTQVMDMVATNVPIRDVVKWLSDSYQSLMASIIKESMASLGISAKTCACISFGSMARGECCLRSDFEWGILVKHNSPQVVATMEKLARLVEFKVICLQESAIGLYRSDVECKIPPGGICVDGKVSPLGSRQLIGTPDEIAALQHPQAVDETPVIANAISCCRLIVGNSRLVSSYERQMSRYIDMGSCASSRANRWGRVRGLLKATQQEFRPDLSVQRRLHEATNVFGIKQELMRPIQEPAAALAMLFQLKEEGTFDRLSRLAKIRVMTPTGAYRLRRAFEKVLRLRLLAHHYYQEENDFIYVPIANEKKYATLGRKMVMTEAQSEEVLEVFQTIIPLSEAILELVSRDEPDVKCLQKSFEIDLVEQMANAKNQSRRADLCRQILAIAPNHRRARDGLEMLIRDKSSNWVEQQELNDILGWFPRHRGKPETGPLIDTLVSQGDSTGISEHSRDILRTFDELHRQMDPLVEKAKVLAKKFNIEIPKHITEAKPRAGEIDLEELLGRAAAGDSDAQLKAGLLYYLGHGVPANTKEARFYFQKAAAAGNARAARYLKSEERDLARRRRDFLLEHGPRRRPPSRLPRVHRRVPKPGSIGELAEKATAGDSQAQIEVGRAYLLGLQGVKKNGHIARRYFRMADKAGHPEAKSYLRKALNLIYGV